MARRTQQFLEEGYRSRKRIALMHENASRAKYGQVRAVTKSDWKSEVSESGDVYVVIHVAERGDDRAQCSMASLSVHSHVLTAVVCRRISATLVRLDDLAAPTDTIAST
ncbi:hypothetical protein AHF37_07673 [Paragonimus kellicotti]|nr:hypothetical protein AHF37_07673 [Paragonimus kellicotti]